MVDLTESTIQANSRLFDSVDEVPRRGLHHGHWHHHAGAQDPGGGQRRGQGRRSCTTPFFGPVTPQVPASVLQLHPDVTVIVDAKAGALCA